MYGDEPIRKKHMFLLDPFFRRIFYYLKHFKRAKNNGENIFVEIVIFFHCENGKMTRSTHYSNLAIWFFFFFVGANFLCWNHVGRSRLIFELLGIEVVRYWTKHIMHPIRLFKTYCTSIRGFHRCGSIGGGRMSLSFCYLIIS